jgi:hypothetical protein
VAQGKAGMRVSYKIDGAERIDTLTGELKKYERTRLQENKNKNNIY